MNKAIAQQVINEWFSQRSQGDEILITFSKDQTMVSISDERV